MTEKEKHYKEFSSIFREKLKQITDPVVNGSRTYQSLEDTITNVILLEINLGKKPWEQIPKKEIKFVSCEDVRADILSTATKEQIAEKLMVLISRDVSYLDHDADFLDKETIKSMGLYAALNNYLTNERTD
jgi:dihydrofolate reductase